MFIIFFLLLSIVALNVLVGLTVDDIRNFLVHADLLKLKLLLQIVLERESGKNLIEPNILSKDPGKFYLNISMDLISKEKIWEKIGKKQEENRRRAELEEEKKDLKDFIHEQNIVMRRKKRLMKRGDQLDKEDDKERKKLAGAEGEKYERSREETKSQKETGSLTSLTSNETESSGEEYEEDDELFEIAKNVKDIKTYLQVSLRAQDVIADQLREKVEKLQNKVAAFESIMTSITH